MSTKLWYDRYRNDWIHALPLGNGRVGAMFYGSPDRETIEINEESLWSGRQIKETNHATPADLQRIRELIFEDRLAEAAQLSRETFLADPPRVRFYESFGEIFMDFADQTDFTDYKKALEGDQNRSEVGGLNFKDNRAAFDHAVMKLREILNA